MGLCQIINILIKISESSVTGNLPFASSYWQISGFVNPPLHYATQDQ